MTDPVTLTLPADARFRGLAPDVAGRYVVAAGGSEADAGVVAEALRTAIDSLAAGAAEDAGVELNFRTPAGPNGGGPSGGPEVGPSGGPEVGPSGGPEVGPSGGPEVGIEVTVKCEGKSSVVTHPLPAAKT